MRHALQTLLVTIAIAIDSRAIEFNRFGLTIRMVVIQLSLASGSQLLSALKEP